MSPLNVTSLVQVQVAWATAWVAWAAWGVWVEAWGVWAQATVTRAVTVTRQGTASKGRQGRALEEEAWAGATANRPRQALGAKGVGTASKGVAVMGDKQVAEGLEALAIDPTDTTTEGQPFSHPALGYYSVTHECMYSVGCNAGLIVCYVKCQASSLQAAAYACTAVSDSDRFVLALVRNVYSLHSAHFFIVQLLVCSLAACKVICWQQSFCMHYLSCGS